MSGVIRSAAVVLGLTLLVGCGGGGSGGSGGGSGGETLLVLAAGPNALTPAAADTMSGSTNLGRLGITGVNAVYDLTTPAGEPFAFDVLSRAAGNSGPVRISLAHAADGGLAPIGGTETIAAAGVVPSASGTTRREEWLDAHGDGFARITMRGAIERDQIFALESESPDGTTTTLVRVSVGPESEINQAARPDGNYPGVLDEAPLYSSDSWWFGLPAIAVSGDRTSIVCYEGDRADPRAETRYEFRLQHGPDGVHGGGALSAGPDTGHWRDHEIAALYNVLAVVRSGDQQVTVRLSFDRGATFAQERSFGAGVAGYNPRLVQIAMALDYETAVVFWRPMKSGTTDLVLVRARPSAYDGSNSPTAFEFDAEELLARVGGDVSPVLLGATFSDGGDLVVGYAYTSFTSDPVDMTWTSTTRSHCAVVPFGSEGRDTLVEEDVIVGRDPSVSVLGSGDTMRIFYAYEGRDGVRLRTSDDAGRTFSAPIRIGDESATNPTVLARMQQGATRVDVVYLAQGEQGSEIHLTHWDDFGAGPATTHRLTTAEMTGTAQVPPGDPVPGVRPGAMLPDDGPGYRIRQVAWFGYDAVLDGDDVVVVYDEQIFDAWVFCMGPPMMADSRFEGGPMAGDASGFLPAEPPPLAEGMTEVLPPADPDHMHQLKLIRLD